MSNDALFSDLSRRLSALETEQAQLQAVDRPLTAAEAQRAGDLADLMALFRLLLERLGIRPAPAPPPSAPAPAPSPPPEPVRLRDGRYEGGNAQLHIELRLDAGASGVISADIYRSDRLGHSYVASVRTVPGEHIDLAAGRWRIAGQDEHGGQANGQLSLTGTGDDPATLSGALFLEQALHGLPVRRDITFAAEWIASEMRTIGIELEREQGVDPLPEIQFGGALMSLNAALQKAGLAVAEAGRPSAIPANDGGWGNTQLHTLLRDFSQASLSRRAWEIHLLLLGKATRTGLLGVMFDTEDQLPRQGTAVFASTIRQLFGSQANRKLIQTTVHELGHALNLAHRFERVVGRADSLSFMNYDWRYRGGNHRHEYWSRFDFSFDHDELEFLRHAPLPALIPGGAAFHSINYWADGNGGYSPYVPEASLPGFRLALRPPRAGQVFVFGQPVFLEVELFNETGQPVDIPPVVLDPKAGFLEILVKRWSGESGTGDLAGADVFVPIIQRCFDLDPTVFDVIPSGQSVKDNLNLTFGSGGFSFAEPGVYDVTALLVIYDRANEQDRVVRSNTLRIRVGVPKSHDEERDGMVLLRTDVGLYFALGGSDGLEKAADDLESIRQKRQGRAKTVTDPVVANIVRCAGINAGRPYIRYQDGKFVSRDGDQAAAAELLESLGDKALAAFDDSTARSTQNLARKHRRAIAL